MSTVFSVTYVYQLFMTNNTFGILSVVVTVQLDPGRLIVEYSRSHTIRHTNKPMDSSQGMINSSQNPLSTQNNKHKRRTFTCSVGSEIAIPAIRKVQTYELDHTATGIGHSSEYIATSDKFVRE